MKTKARACDYKLIYDLKDCGTKNADIKRHLKISEGTLRHSLILRKKAVLNATF